MSGALNGEAAPLADIGTRTESRHSPRTALLGIQTEIDLQVFSLLVELDIIEINRASYRIARALNITPSKAKTLLFQYQLRNLSEDETDYQIVLAITTARYWKDGDKLSFGVTSPLVKAAAAIGGPAAGGAAAIKAFGDSLSK